MSSCRNHKVHYRVDIFVFWVVFFEERLPVLNMVLQS